LGAHPDEEVKILVKLGTPMLTSFTPNFCRITRTGDAVKDPGDRSGGESLITVIENQTADGGPDELFLIVRTEDDLFNRLTSSSFFFEIIFDETPQFVALGLVHRLTAGSCLGVRNTEQRLMDALELLNFSGLAIHTALMDEL
jgi:hypothetical protein